MGRSCTQRTTEHGRYNVGAMTERTEEFPHKAELTHLLVVSELSRSVTFYRDVVGAALVREYGGTSAVFRLAGTWLLLVTSGGPTADKPTVTFAPPVDPNRVSSEMTFRVDDCRGVYATLLARGAVFLTPPFDHGYEVRCFFRDPDGHLLELSEVPATEGG
jgi:catechol 2,3-dioxygenase-like lactoylglutathione lyase family enzyme